MRGFGIPLHEDVAIRAQVIRPDGTVIRMPLQHTADGVFSARLDFAKLPGNYQIVIRASGRTPSKLPLQRELTMTAAIITPTAKNETDILTTELGKLIKDEQTSLQQLSSGLTALLAAVESLGGKPGMQSSGNTLSKWLLWIAVLMILLLLIVMIMLARL
jgi:hypothetical protein